MLEPVKGLSLNEILRYRCQYILDDDSFVDDWGGICTDCPELVVEPDIDWADCKHGGEFWHAACPRSGDFAMFFKAYLVEADLQLRARLGDRWHDKYSA